MGCSVGGAPLGGGGGGGERESARAKEGGRPVSVPARRVVAVTLTCAHYRQPGAHTAYCQAQSQLARDISAVYTDLVETGTVQMLIGGWVTVSFRVCAAEHPKYRTADLTRWSGPVKQRTALPGWVCSGGHC